MTWCDDRGTLVTRRELCRAAVGSAAALLAAPLLSAAQPAKPGLRYILASSLYGMGRLEEILPEVGKTGTDLVDLWPKHHADQRDQVEEMGHEKFAALLARHRVRLGMTTRYDLGPLKLIEEMRFLKRFGGRLVVTGSVGPRDLSGPECKVAVKKFIEEMKPQVEAAEQCGVTIGIENHARALIATVDSIRYLAELSPSPRLGIALAPYHLPQDEKLLAQLVTDLGPKLVHFYAWQYGEGCMKPMPKEQELKQMPGRGTLDFRPILAAMKKGGYPGWTEIFMHPTPRGIPILPTTAEVTAEVVRAKSYLDRCWAEA